MSGPVQRAITEAVETVASSEARVAILIRALARSGLAKVPERGPEVLRFVEGPWFEAVSETLGVSTAEELVDQLRPLLRFAARPQSKAPTPDGKSTMPPPAEPRVSERSTATGSLRPTVPAEEPETRPPESGTQSISRSEPVGEDAHFVLVTLDEALVEALEAECGERLRVARGLMEILDAADDFRGKYTVILFDSHAPPVHIASLMMLAPDVPVTTEFRILGASEEDRATLASAGERGAQFVHVGRSSDAAAVVRSLFRYVGDAGGLR